MTSIIPAIFPLHYNLSIDSPFVDWLSFTVPTNEGESLVKEFDSILAIFGSTRGENNLYRIPTENGFATCKIDCTANFYLFSLSGRLLAHMRAFRVMNDVLYAISQVIHKITRLDVACDYNVDAPLAIKQLAVITKASGVRFTRKHISSSHTKKILSDNRHGVETGTLYLGRRASADVCCRVYDKSHEMYQNSAIEIPPRLRIEFTFKGDVLPTLRDVSLPSNIFYHHALHTLAMAPPMHQDWNSHGYAYKIDKKPAKTAYEKMRGLFDFSTDIEKLCKYALEEFGEKASDELSRMMRYRLKKSLRGMGWNPMQASLF